MNHVTLSTLSFHNTFKRLKLRAPLCAFFLIIPFVLTGCETQEPEESFPTPNYSYLPRLYLNIGTININNQAPEDENNLASQSPTSTYEELTLMAKQRLKTTGMNGTASFTITQANITKESHSLLSGDMSVRLTLDDPIQHHRGHITATVHRNQTISSELSKESNLYQLNQSMMDDMNVEIEYQIRKHLSSWLTDAAGTPLNTNIKSQNLDSTQISKDTQKNTSNNSSLHTSDLDDIHSP